MNSNKILEVINEIAANSSKIAKVALISEAIKDEDFKRVCEYAYSPFKTYGLRKRPETIGENCSHEFDEGTWELLDDLISRRASGDSAIEYVRGEMTALSKESAELFWRIISKDLRAGFSESTINKACKGLIPEFPYMRCSLPKDVDLEKWPWAEGVISQEKADGMFANVDHEAIGGNVSIRSRQGTEFPMGKFVDVANDVRARLRPDMQYHGEFLVLRDGVVCARQDGNGVMNHVIDGGDFAPNEKPIFMVWDGIPLNAVLPKGRCLLPYKVRLAEIARSLNMTIGSSVKLIPTMIVRSLAEAKLHAVAFMKAGKEGSVIKRPDAIWVDSTSKEQVKIKLEFVVDLEITAIVPGKEGKKTEGRAGSLTCQTSDGKLIVDVTVKNEKMRDDVDANPDKWIGGIIGVVANDILLPSESNDFHSLFLPRMVESCLRDKSSADSLEKVFEQKHAAIYGEELMKEAA